MSTLQARPVDAADAPSKQALRLWLRLLSCTNLIEQAVRARLRNDFGVTLPQFDVLAELDAASGPQTMTGLSQRLMVSNGNVTGVVDRLERAGLVTRTASSSDRRVQFIALTDAGRARFAEVAAAHEAWVAELLAEVGAADVERLLELLAETKRAVQQRVGTPHPEAG
ncbi:MAG TPA: MarR family transcriptional regulator [Gammaproteobacteria bacterium]